MKFVTPKGDMEWKIVLSSIGYAVDGDRVCDAMGHSPLCGECSKALTVGDIGLIYRKDGEVRLICQGCHLFVVLEMLDDTDDLETTEFDATKPDEFIEKVDKLLSRKE